MASYHAPGKYYIKPQYLSEIDLDKWPYTYGHHPFMLCICIDVDLNCSDEELQKVLSQCQKHGVTPVSSGKVRTGSKSSDASNGSVASSERRTASNIAASQSMTPYAKAMKSLCKYNGMQFVGETWLKRMCNRCGGQALFKVLRTIKIICGVPMLSKKTTQFTRRPMNSSPTSVTSLRR